MEYILCFVAGWFLGRAVLKFSLFREAINSMSPAEKKKFMTGYEPEQLPILHTETVDDSLHLYDTKTSMFMCHGKTLDDLASNLKLIRHIHVAQVLHDSKTVLFVDGKVAESL